MRCDRCRSSVKTGLRGDLCIVNDVDRAAVRSCNLGVCCEHACCVKWRIVRVEIVGLCMCAYSIQSVCPSDPHLVSRIDCDMDVEVRHTIH